MTMQEPELQEKTALPKGVLPRNLKLYLYLGVAALFIIATAVSSLHHKPGEAHKTQTGQPPASALQDNSQQNIEELRRSLQDQQQTSAGQPVTTTNSTATQQASAAQYALNGQSMQPANCVPGQPCQQAYNQPAQLTPQQQAAMQLEEQEKELAYKARFSSNLAYSQSHNVSNGQVGQTSPGQASQNTTDSYSQSTLQGTQQSNVPQHQPDTKRSSEVNIDSAKGQPYVVYEGTVVDAVLMNRLDGDSVGPVKALVTDPVYSHDRQHVLIPEGTVVLGEARKIGNAGFGQQRRMAVVFHRMIMPDGYSVDLDQFQGLDQRRRQDDGEQA